MNSAASNLMQTDHATLSALRKTAWRFVPLLTLAYVFNYLDRTCIGFAALTMNRDIGLTPAQFGLGAGVFFLGYCVFEVPSNLMMYRFGARRWIARIMISWGLLSACTAFVIGPNSFYGLRLGLGIAEAGFFPGVTYFLAAWFPAQYRTRILAWFLLGIPLSSVIGGPLCGLLLQMDGIFGLAGWKWLFLVVSLPCVVLGILILRNLADTPQKASWLTQAERDALDAALQSEVRERPKSSVLAAITDPRVLILAGVQFGFTLGSYGIGIWLPLILKGHQMSNLSVGFISAIPYLFASVGMMAWAFWVDRAGKKIFHLAITRLLGALGLAGSVASGGLWPALAGLTVALIGVTAARAVFWTIPTRFLTGIAAAGGLAFINSVGTLGGFAGPLHDGRTASDYRLVREWLAGDGWNHGRRDAAGGFPQTRRYPGVTSMLTRRAFTATLAAAPVLAKSARAAALPDMPADACDCHVHIIGPQDRYPMVPNRAYTPPGSSVAELLMFRRRLDLARTVLIQPSLYGTDNRAMLDALGELNGSARGIAVLDSEVPEAELKSLDAAGVRGIRLNIESGGGRDPRDITEPLAAFARRLAPLGWHIQIYAKLSLIAQIAAAVRELPVPVVFDHFGMPDAALGPDQPGFPVLLDLLRARQAYVKLSAPYRISKRPDFSDVLPIAQALVAAGPGQLVWASDWPHTDRAAGAMPTTVSPFRVVDDAAVLALLASWCPDPAQRRAILAETPARLYRFS